METKENKDVKETKANRTLHDTLFRFIFNDKESAIELYNALEGTNYDMDTELEFTTLKNLFYVQRRNDLGFQIDGRFVVLTEHQSTINYNMPVRFLDYVAQTYQNLLLEKQDDLYHRKPVQLMTPEFFVIYTGKEDWKETELHLSDSFIADPPKNSMDLVVKIIDVRYNKKEAAAILSRSEKLRGYSLLLKYVRDYREEGYELKEAIDLSVRRCITEDVLKDFLIKYGREVREMLYEGITAEEFAEIRGREEREEGRAEGLAEGRAEGLAEGHYEEKLSIARNLLAEGSSVELISKATGLTIEEIQNLTVTE